MYICQYIDQVCLYMFGYIYIYVCVCILYEQSIKIYMMCILYVKCIYAFKHIKPNEVQKKFFENVQLICVKRKCSISFAIWDMQITTTFTLSFPHQNGECQERDHKS